MDACRSSCAENRSLHRNFYKHKWMLVEVPVQRPVLYPQGQENEPSIGEFNEQVLRLMHGLGIDQQKTVEVQWSEV